MDMSRPGIKPGPPWGEVSILEKRHLNSLFIAIQNIYCTYKRATKENACDNIIEIENNQEGFLG
jgi:hypothetical protein